MANNIFQIWDALSRQTPFAVIRDYWKPGYYVIVQRVECEKMPYGQAFGIPVCNGRYSDRLEYDKKWVKTGLIPCCGTYQWTHVPDVNLNVERPGVTQGSGQLSARVHTEACYLQFGKYNGRTVKQVFKERPSYLTWLMENVERFMLEPSSITEFERGGFHFPEKTKQLNEQKITQLDVGLQKSVPAQDGDKP
ncbi:MAG: hypothetical protein WAT61_10705 [Flavobacteriales bacterium]|nr:hypothetical protein [Flavobacteriales bacterium]